jgi:hypothetical protein
MDAEATIINLRRASARERMARIRAKKKEEERIREREAIAIAADRRRASACKRAARSRAKKKEVAEWIREREAIAIAADRRRAIAVAADRRRASARESMARIRAKKKEARHAAVEVEASTTPPTTTTMTMEAVAAVVADGKTTTGTAVFPTPTTKPMTTTTTTTTTGLTTGLTATWKVLSATYPVADTTRTSRKTTMGMRTWMGTMTTDFLQQSTVQKGAVEEMRTERTKLLTASAGRGGDVDDGVNDIHDPSPDVNVVSLTGDDCDDENAAATPGGCDRGTMGGCGSDRCSGQSICKERGRAKRKEEEASSKEHDERINNGAPPRRQRPRRLPCLRDRTNPPRSNTITMTIEPVHEIEINGVKHPCPHFEFDPNNQNVEK